MSIEVQIVHSVDEIGQAAWDALSHGRPFASYRWYRFGERVLSQETPAYVIVYHYGQAIARATFWLTRQEPLPIESTVIRRLMEALFRRWPLLMCRAPLAETSGLILPDSPWRSAALSAIVQAAKDFGKRHHASFVFFAYLGGRDLEMQPWREDIRPVTIPNPGTCLTIAWPDFAAYFNHLPKSARKHYRQTCKHNSDSGIVITTHPRVKAVDEAMTLIRNVEARHNSSPKPWAKALLENMALVDAAWLTAERDGRLVGCELLTRDGDAWMIPLLGLDYSLRYVYYRLGYEDIRYVIDRGARVLRGGSGAYAEKERWAFRREDNNHLAVVANNKALHSLMARLAAY
jgi:predicted N-acyltransferase